MTSSAEKPRKKSWYKDKDSFCSWIKSPTFAIYLNYALSAWGDRMWHFAAGLYLVYLANGHLRLTAIFGFTGGTLMLVLGGIIGNWVDKNGRMKVVTISLFIQNISVALCAVAVYLGLTFQDTIYSSDSLHVVVEGIIICLALIAYLISMAYKVAIEKDWIVVVAGGDSSQLSNMNAVTRAIDLTCKILSPTVAGIIMSYSQLLAAICIAVWNVVSVFCEYALLRRVYRLVPDLAVKGKSEEVKETELQDMSSMKPSTEETEPMNKDFPSLDSKKSRNDSDNNDSLHKSNGSLLQEELKPLNSNKALSVSAKSLEAGKCTTNNNEEKTKKTCFQLATEPFVTLVRGWRTYVRQKVMFAGFGLACLYMTVLGFDCVTTGYIYANGVKASYVGLSMGAAGFTGIIGTFIFTRVKPRLGLERTGLIAFSAEILCLTLTVISVWAPGTVFDPTFARPEPNCTLAAELNVTGVADHAVHMEGIVEMPVASSERPKRDLALALGFASDEMDLANPAGWSLTPAYQMMAVSATSHRYRRDVMANSSSVTPSPDSTAINNQGSDEPCAAEATLSIILFLVGIVTSRIGLWMSDLVITQLFQESVAETERGIVNGVQNSMNMLNDMIKFALVIVLPHIKTFGILIVLSFIFICLGGGFFTIYVARIDRRILCCKSPRPADGETKNPDLLEVGVDVTTKSKDAEEV